MLQNFMSLECPDSDARSSRIALKDELASKLVFDDPGVFERLALDRVSPQFVANCAKSFTTNQDLFDARRELDKITAAAISKPVEELEADDDVRDSFGIREVKKKVEEKKMYKPLVYYRPSHSRGLLFIILNTRGPYFNTWRISRIRSTLYQNILLGLRI